MDENIRFHNTNHEHSEYLGYLNKTTVIDKEIALTLSTYDEKRKSVDLSLNHTAPLKMLEESRVMKLTGELVMCCYEWNSSDEEAKHFVIPCCNGVKIDYNTKNSFLNDIKLLCIVYCTKGWCQHDIKYYSCSQMIELFDILTDKYRLIHNSFLGNPDYIYLKKIGRCFPVACCELYARGVYSHIIDNNALGKPLVAKQTAVLCPVFPLLVTKKLLRKSDNIVPHLFWISYLNHMSTITRKQIKASAASVWCSLKRMLLSGHYLDENRKLKKCQSWNLIDKEGNIDQVFVLTRQICIDNLARVFGEDSTWLTVKSEFSPVNI